MGAKWEEHTRRAELVIYPLADGGWHGALFSSHNHGRGEVRRALVNGVDIPAIESGSLADVLVALRAALDRIEQGQYTPPR